ncbi:MAG: peptidoglycan editing factor PgeF [bacterium]|nr:peptidoglycan editing factor PgeF [bacterium]
MNEYNPERIFDTNNDQVHYKYENSVYNIKYNNGSEHALLNTEHEAPFVHFETLDRIEGIKHGFSTRLGGVSTGDFTTLNLSFVRGDEEDAVKENYERILSAMGMQDTDLAFSDQVHDTLVHRITKEDVDKDNRFTRKLVGIDGLITNEPGITLITSYADCVPLYFVDPVKKAIGLSHSGWKGTVNKIGKKTVEAMAKEFGSDPEDIIAVIGPSICFDCYEVSEDVATAFMGNFTNEITSKILYNKGNGKYQLDLWLVNKYILMEAGLKEQNITNSNLCTCCNHSLLFSHRASGGKRGNLAAFMCLK